MKTPTRKPGRPPRDQGEHRAKVTVWLPSSVLRTLDRQAGRIGDTRSQVIVELVRKHL